MGGTAKTTKQNIQLIHRCTQFHVGRHHEINTTEQCDDGNRDNGDGCSQFCQIEEGYACSGTPSECAEQDTSGAGGEAGNAGAGGEAGNAGAGGESASEFSCENSNGENITFEFDAQDGSSDPRYSTTCNGGIGGQTINADPQGDFWRMSSDWNVLVLEHAVSPMPSAYEYELEFRLESALTEATFSFNYHKKPDGWTCYEGWNGLTLKMTETRDAADTPDAPYMRAYASPSAGAYTPDFFTLVSPNIEALNLFSGWHALRVTFYPSSQRGVLHVDDVYITEFADIPVEAMAPTGLLKVGANANGAGQLDIRKVSFQDCQ